MGEINVGDRVAVSNHLGIIREKGPEYVENNLDICGNRATPGDLPGDFLSDHTFLVEWDDMTKGDFTGDSKRFKRLKATELQIMKHFSDLKGSMFESTETCRILDDRFLFMDTCKPFSLVPRDQIDTGSTFESEFASKYLTKAESIEVIEMEDSDRKYEFVGVDKAITFFSDRKNLFAVDLNDSKISSAGNMEMFPNCTELYLANNMLSSSEINGMLPSFPRLAILDVSRNKLDLPVVAPNVSTLVMNGNFSEFQSVLATLNECPKVSELVLTDNFITKIYHQGSTYPLVHSIDLSRNYLHSWKSLFGIFTLFPNLKRLVLQSNFLSSFDFDLAERPTYPELVYLDVSNNLIDDVDSLVTMSHMFPNLTRLKISSNPIVFEPTKQMTQFAALNNKTTSDLNEILRMFILVTFPNLTVLNGTTITIQEKTNSQRYLKHLENKGAILPTENSAVLLNRTRVKVLLIPDGDADSFAFEPVEKKLAESCTIADLKLLCSRLFKMNLKDIKLSYNSRMMPLCEDLDDDTADLGRYGISDGYEIRVQNKNFKL